MASQLDSLFGKKTSEKTAKSGMTDSLFANSDARINNGQQNNTIYDIPLEQLEEFPDHPFTVRDNDDMDALMASIKKNGILNPALVIQARNLETNEIIPNKYFIVCGHRRKRACERLGMSHLRCEFDSRLNMDFEEAKKHMSLENLLHRQSIPIVERARAIKVIYEAEITQRKKARVEAWKNGEKFESMTKNSLEALVEIVKDKLGYNYNEKKCQRLMRLCELTDDVATLLEQNRIDTVCAEKISYLSSKAQQGVARWVDANEEKPSEKFINVLREKEKNGEKITDDVINDVLRGVIEAKDKKEEIKAKYKFNSERINHYLVGIDKSKQEDFICEALDFYMREHSKTKKQDTPSNKKTKAPEIKSKESLSR